MSLLIGVKFHLLVAHDFRSVVNDCRCSLRSRFLLFWVRSLRGTMLKSDYFWEIPMLAKILRCSVLKEDYLEVPQSVILGSSMVIRASGHVGIICACRSK